jgi:acetyl esterase
LPSFPTSPSALAPEVRELLAWDERLGSRIRELPISEQRLVVRDALEELAEKLGMKMAEVASVRDYDVPVEGGDIRIRVYTPRTHNQPGAFFHIHGGGFMLGGINWRVNELKCAHIAATAGCVVTTLDYRLAPEHPYPTATRDCYAALLWVVEHAAALRIDPARIVVGGESAGGNLAAALALMARDLDGPALALQLLEVPVTDMSDTSASHPSRDLYGSGYGLDSAGIDAFTEAYAPIVSDRLLPYVSPFRTPNPEGVAPAHILTAEFDPLRDSGEAYATRLKKADVPTALRRFDGHTHGSSVLWQTWGPAEDWMAHVVEAVRLGTQP